VGPAGTENLDMNGNNITNVNTLQINDGGCISLGSTTSVNQSKCIAIEFISNVNNSLSGLIVQVVEVDGAARVEPITNNLGSGDNPGRKILDVTTEPIILGEPVKVCIGCIFAVVVEDGQTINIGDIIQPTVSAGNDGRAINGVLIMGVKVTVV